MDIYVAKDGVYPPALRSSDELFVLVGDHSAFVRAYLHAARARSTHVFVATTFVVPDMVTGALRVTNPEAGAAFERFAMTPHAFATGPTPRELPDASDPGTLVVNALCIPAAPGRAVQRAVFVHCVPLAALPPDLAIDGVPVTDASFMYTTPLLAHRLSGCDHATRDAVFRNVALRAAVGEMIRNPDGAPLATLLARTAPLSRSATRVAVLPVGNADAVRLARFSYDRDQFRAFVVAWYRGQMSAMPDENEKIARAYERVLRLI